MDGLDTPDRNIFSNYLIVSNRHDGLGDYGSRRCPSSWHFEV